MARGRSERSYGRGWRNAGLVAASVGLNAGLIALLYLGETQPRTLARASPRPLYLDIEPRQPLATDRSAPVAPRRPDLAASPAARQVVASHLASDEVPPPAPAVPAGPSIDERWRVAPGTAPRAGRAGAGLTSCDAPHRLSVEDRRRCDARWARPGEGSRVITGSGDPERDAAFARQGARRLAAWEAQRAEPPRGDPPCENPNPMSGCEGVNVSVELFSSRDGILPNLRKRRE